MLTAFEYDIRVQTSDFDVGTEYLELCQKAPHSGAVVFFVGLVRDYYSEDSDDEKVEHLFLEHYPGMTESLCQKIVEQAFEQFPFDHVKVLHRVGQIMASEQIVMVAVASRHRENAFQAAQFIMDYLKTQATFWKKEVGSMGEQWLGVKDKDRHAQERWVIKTKLETKGS